MIFLFLFFFQSRSEIVHEFRNLVDKAYQMSKNKIPKQERSEKTIPGDYSLDEAKFTLRRTLVTPKTKDIKGFAIENRYLALVKRKSFNLKDDFAFIDPSNQKYYSVSSIVSSDEHVNIYSTKELTIFDLITNFKYNHKTTKEYTPIFDIDWNETQKFPKLHPIDNTTSKVSFGIRGTFSNDITMTFNTKYDVYISSKLELEAHILSKIQLQKGNLSEVTDNKLFEREPLSMEGFDYEFEFRGIKIQINPFIKGEISLRDDLYSQLEESIDLSKEYEIYGTKTIEITNYALNNPKWNFQIVQKQVNYLTNSIHIPKDSKFKITPELKFHYSTEIKIGEMKTLIISGLIIPVKFEFETNKDDLFKPGFCGEISSSIQMFNKIEEMKIQFPSSYKNAQNITIIPSFNDDNDQVPIKDITTGKIIFKTTNMFYEQDPNSLQNETSNYSLIETISLHIKQKSSFYVSYHLGLYYIYKYEKHVSFPFFEYPTTPTKYHYNLFVPKYNLDFIPYIYEFKHIDDYKAVPERSQYTKDSTKKIDFNENLILYKVYSSIISLKNDPNNSIIGNFVIWRCQKIHINKVFCLNNNTLPFTIFDNYNDNEKYALVLIDSQYGSKVDFNAQFSPEAGLHKDYHQKGIFSPPDFSYYEISIYSFKEIFRPTLTLYSNLTLIKTKNGKSVSQFFGVFMTPGSNYPMIGSFSYNNDVFRFTLDADETVEFKIDMQITRYIPTGHEVENKSVTYHHSDIIGKSILDLSVPGNFEFKFNISKIELPVAIRHSFNDVVDGQGVLTKVKEIDIDIHGEIKISFGEDEYYYVLKIQSSKYPIKSFFLFMKTTEIALLGENIKMISNDVYYLYCESDSIFIPIRRKSNKGEFKITYLLAETEDPNDMKMDKTGTSLLFKNSNTAKAFIVDSYMNKYHIDTAKTSLTYYSIDIDSNSKLLGIRNPNYNDNDEPISIISTYAFLGENQFSIEVDLSELYSKAKASGKEKFNFYIIVERENVENIRMINKKYEQESEVDKGIAKFTIEILPDNEIESTTQFIAICSDSNAINCALTFIPGSGYYQLIKFPNKEGLNTTGRGHSTSLIEAPANVPYYYHKLFEGEFTYVRSYQEKTQIKMTINDVYPYDNIETNNKYNEEDEYPNIQTTVTSAHHNLKDAYRKFCLKDHFLNNLPFSMNYLSNNYEEFFEQLGVNKNIDDSQFTINDKDECIKVDIQMIEKDIKTVTTKIIDLGVMNNNIQIEYISNTKEDTDNDRDSAGDKEKKNKNVIYFAIIGVLAVVIIAVVIIVVVFLLKRSHKDDSINKRINETNNDNMSDDDKYVNSV